MTTESKPREWPSREEWAKDRRTFYAGMLLDVECSRKTADYATAAEIADAINDLKVKWKAQGRIMQAAGGVDRFEARETRRRINRALAEIIAGKLPVGSWDLEKVCKDVPSAMVLIERYEAAKRAAIAAKECAVEARPIDDAEWAKELERRASIEAWRVRGHMAEG